MACTHTGGAGCIHTTLILRCKPVACYIPSTAVHSDRSSLVKCHKRFVKRNINILNILTVCDTNAPVSQLGKCQRP
jgi:hypothetical protein